MKSTKKSNICEICGLEKEKYHYQKHHNHMTGIVNKWGHHTKETKKKISLAGIGRFKRFPIEKQKELRQKMKLRFSGKNNPMYGNTIGFNKGYHHTEETKEKMRKSIIKHIENTKLKGLPLIPCIGKNESIALNIIEQKLNIKITRQYKVLGYFLDGYDEINNVVYEVYENYHNVKKQMKKDKLRENNIIKELNCAYVKINDFGGKQYAFN